MNNTALGAENKKEQTINFISEAHEKFYYEKLKEVRYQDVYHKALCYCLGISDDTRRNVDSIYDFKMGCVKTECLHEGWQTSGSMKVVRMALNLYCNGTCHYRRSRWCGCPCHKNSCDHQRNNKYYTGICKEIVHLLKCRADMRLWILYLPSL